MFDKINKLIDDSQRKSWNYAGSDGEFLEYCYDMIYYKFVSLNKYCICRVISIDVRDINSAIRHMGRDGVNNEPRWGTEERMKLLVNKLKPMGFNAAILFKNNKKKDPIKVIIEVPPKI